MKDSAKKKKAYPSQTLLPKTETREEIFIRQYLVHFNAARAVRESGYSDEQTVSYNEGARLLRIPRVVEKIRAEMKARLDSLDATGERILQELKSIAFAQLADCFDEDGKMLSVHDMPPECRAALSTVETDEIFAGRGEKRIQIGKMRKVKMADKLKALELLGKYRHLFSDHLEVSGPNGGPQVVLTIPANTRETQVSTDSVEPDIDDSE